MSAPAGFSLGINTCFAVKRWPQPEEWSAIVRDELGLDLVQHSLDLVDLGGPEVDDLAQATRVRDATVAAGIEVHSTFTGLAAYSSNLLLDPDPAARRRAERWFERAIAFSSASGARHVGGHVGSLSVADAADPDRSAERWSVLRTALARLAAATGDAGMESFLVENMACAREPSRMDQLRALLDAGDAERAPITLCLDVGHQCVPGTSGDERDPYAWLAALGARAPVVHLQQTDEDSDRHGPFTAAGNAAGRIEAPRVLDALAASGASGTALILEVIHPFEAEDDRVLAELAESVAYWREALQAHAASAADGPSVP